ncbi:MAG: epimerase [Nannocystaceae bacterium]
MTPRLGRRALLHGALGGAALLACEPAPWPLRVLVLGGTGYVGPPIVEALQARGHALTLFNRGRTDPGRFAGIEQLRGDRDRDGGLAALEGRRWDVVVDVSGILPSWVDASARLLAPAVSRYLLISSTAVYQRLDRPPLDESSPLRPSPARPDDRRASNGERKAGCERVAAAAMPGRTCFLRAIWIVGDEDPGDQLQAWLLRVAEGGPMATPGPASRRILYLDRRDLARSTAMAVEYGALGPYNLCQRASVGALVDAAAAITGGAIEPRWLDDERLATSGAGQAFPLVHRFEGRVRLAPELDVSRALAAGMRPRPLTATLAAVWDELQGASPASRARARERWPSPARERELLEPWTIDPDAAGPDAAGPDDPSA